jgi:predicted transcriptional regulator
MASVITIRGLSPDLHERLRELARQRGEGLNRTVVRLLEEAVGVGRRRQRLARHATWSPQDLADFMEALRAQRGIDRAG